MSSLGHARHSQGRHMQVSHTCQISPVAMGPLSNTHWVCRASLLLSPLGHAQNTGHWFAPSSHVCGHTGTYVVSSSEILVASALQPCTSVAAPNQHQHCCWVTTADVVSSSVGCDGPGQLHCHTVCVKVRPLQASSAEKLAWGPLTQIWGCL